MRQLSLSCSFSSLLLLESSQTNGLFWELDEICRTFCQYLCSTDSGYKIHPSKLVMTQKDCMGGL